MPLTITQENLALRLFRTDSRILAKIEKVSDTDSVSHEDLLQRAWEVEIPIREECLLRAKQVFDCKAGEPEETDTPPVKQTPTADVVLTLPTGPRGEGTLICKVVKNRSVGTPIAGQWLAGKTDILPTPSDPLGKVDGDWILRHIFRTE